jgi:hypothetical protein
MQYYICIIMYTLKKLLIYLSSMSVESLNKRKIKNKKTVMHKPQYYQFN